MKKHTIKLSAQERHQLQDIIGKGEHKARVVKRAQMLLASHQGAKDTAIAASVGVTTRTVENVRKRYVIGNLKQALYDAPRPGGRRVLTDKTEARLVALACSAPPAGCDHWTLEMLQKRLIKDKVVRKVSTVTLWHHLNERGIKPWREKNVVYPEADRGIYLQNGKYPGSVRQTVRSLRTSHLLR